MLFICVGLAYASDSYSQNVLLNIDVNNKSVQEVLDEIEKQSDFHFFYNNKQVNTSRIVYNPQNQKSRFQKRKIKKNGKRFVDSLYSLIDLKTIWKSFKREGL